MDIDFDPDFSATFFFAVLFILLFILIAGTTLNNSSDDYVKRQGYITGNTFGKRGGRYNERMSNNGNFYRQYFKILMDYLIDENVWNLVLNNQALNCLKF